MELKDIKLVKGMTRGEVNELISKWVSLKDEIYLGCEYKHNWTCLCGDIIEGRTWVVIRKNNIVKCEKCKYNEIEQRYKTEVEKGDEYEYIRSYRRGDILPNGRAVGRTPYIQIKHKYCGSVYEVTFDQFKNINVRCSKCCRTYENSFAHYIEQELKLDITDIWNFEKNTVNPYHISKSSDKKVWIKCQEKDYHNDYGGYEIRCKHFKKGHKCSYCASHKIHPLDSFGYHNFDKVMSWHPDNNISPFKVSRASGKKYKFVCDECGHVWGVTIYDISSGKWCPQCKSSKGEKRIKEYLDKNNINYESQKEYKRLVGLGGGRLSYDFYLPDYNLLIEYQGEQHEKYIPGLHENRQSFETQIEHDIRKWNYAYKNKIDLLEIWYYNFDNIDVILSKKLEVS